MIENHEIEQIKNKIEELLAKMTIEVLGVTVTASSAKVHQTSLGDGATQEITKDVVNVDISIQDPQMLIGQSGQTLFEFQRLLKIIFNKTLQKSFYLNIDINDYKKKKVEYLKSMAVSMADEVSKTKEKKVLPPMPSYERRIIHAELSGRQDVITESSGQGEERSVIIKPN